MGPKVARFSMAEFETYVYQRQLIVYAQQKSERIENRLFNQCHVRWPVFEVN